MVKRAAERRNERGQNEADEREGRSWATCPLVLVSRESCVALPSRDLEALGASGAPCGICGAWRGDPPGAACCLGKPPVHCETVTQIALSTVICVPQKWRNANDVRQNRYNRFRESISSLVSHLVSSMSNASGALSSFASVRSNLKSLIYNV